MHGDGVQRYRAIMVFADISRPDQPRTRAAYDQQVAHFKPYREHTVPMTFAVEHAGRNPAPPWPTAAKAPLAPQMLDCCRWFRWPCTRRALRGRRRLLWTPHRAVVG